MDDDVKKWLKKKMEEVGTQDASPLPEVKPQKEPNDMSKEINVEDEIQKSIDFPKGPDTPTTELSTSENILEKSEGEKPHDSSNEPPHSGAENVLESQKIKDKVNMERIHFYGQG